MSNSSHGYGYRRFDFEGITICTDARGTLRPKGANCIEPLLELEALQPGRESRATGHRSSRPRPRTIDIAIYAFTDQYIARELIEVANRGVHIRLYRDREQWEQEQSRRNSTAEMLAGNAKIEIRVKPRNGLL